MTVVDTIPIGFYDIEFNPLPGSGYVRSVATGIFLVGSTDLGTFELPAAVVVSGLVVDADGIGVPGIDLQFTASLGTLVDFGNDDTNEQGFFTVEITDGTWGIQFRQVVPGATSYLPQTIPAQEILDDIEIGPIVLMSAMVARCLARSSALSRLITVIAARIPRTATTISNSISVKPASPSRRRSLRVAGTRVVVRRLWFMAALTCFFYT